MSETKPDETIVEDEAAGEDDVLDKLFNSKSLDEAKGVIVDGVSDGVGKLRQSSGEEIKNSALSTGKKVGKRVLKAWRELTDGD